MVVKVDLSSIEDATTRRALGKILQEIETMVDSIRKGFDDQTLAVWTDTIKGVAGNLGDYLRTKYRIGQMTKED